jgi:hypothetical protein
MSRSTRPKGNHGCGHAFTMSCNRALTDEQGRSGDDESPTAATFFTFGEGVESNRNVSLGRALYDRVDLSFDGFGASRSRNLPYRPGRVARVVWFRLPQS